MEIFNLCQNYPRAAVNSRGKVGVTFVYCSLRGLCLGAKTRRRPGGTEERCDERVDAVLEARGGLRRVYLDGGRTWIILEVRRKRTPAHLLWNERP